MLSPRCLLLLLVMPPSATIAEDGGVRPWVDRMVGTVPSRWQRAPPEVHGHHHLGRRRAWKVNELLPTNPTVDPTVGYDGSRQSVMFIVH
jgi:hypothetical protein